MTNKEEEKKKKDVDNKDGIVKSDPETLHTPDPQKEMEGPVSSFIEKIGESFDDKDAVQKPIDK